MALGRPTEVVRLGTDEVEKIKCLQGKHRHGQEQLPCVHSLWVIFFSYILWLGY